MGGRECVWMCVYVLCACVRVCVCVCVRVWCGVVYCVVLFCIVLWSGVALLQFDLFFCKVMKFVIDYVYFTFSQHTITDYRGT